MKKKEMLLLIMLCFLLVSCTEFGRDRTVVIIELLEFRENHTPAECFQKCSTSTIKSSLGDTNFQNSACLDICKQDSGVMQR